MSSTAQINANRENAQSSTGPKTPEGKQKSSVNATTHSFTGAHVLVTPGEEVAYDNHCNAYFDMYRPGTHEETDLIQQYADQQWTLHQINIQQITVLSMINVATAHHVKEGSDFDVLNAAVAPFYKQINTLSIYEQRRRRAATAILARYQELVVARATEVLEAARICKAVKAQGKIFNPAEFGFVYSAAEIETYLARVEARNALAAPRA